MELVRISDPGHVHFATILKLYESTFPLGERRTSSSFQSLVRHSDFHLMSITDEDEMVGFVSWWPVMDFLFIEHFAIAGARRGRFYGSRVIQHMITISGKRLLLETELASKGDTEKRISFYLRNGLVVAPYQYLQPPYRQGEDPVEMHLMSSLAFSEEEDFRRIAHSIDSIVYEPFR